MLRWGPSVAEMSPQLGSHQGCVLGLSQRSHDVRECFAYSSTHRRGASGILMLTHLGSQQIGSVGFPAPALGLLVCLAGLFSVNIRFMWEKPHESDTQFQSSMELAISIYPCLFSSCH